MQISLSVRSFFDVMGFRYLRLFDAEFLPVLYSSNYNIILKKSRLPLLPNLSISTRAWIIWQNLPPPGLPQMRRWYCRIYPKGCFARGIEGQVSASFRDSKHCIKMLKNFCSGTYKQRLNSIHIRTLRV